MDALFEWWEISPFWGALLSATGEGSHSVGGRTCSMLFGPLNCHLRLGGVGFGNVGRVSFACCCGGCRCYFCYCAKLSGQQGLWLTATKLYTLVFTAYYCVCLQLDECNCRGGGCAGVRGRSMACCRGVGLG